MCVTCVVCVWCVWCVCGVCGVCGTNDSRHGESVLARAYYAPNWVAEHLGASSRRPRHPFPALMAGANPGRCTCVHGPKSQVRRQLRRPLQKNCTGRTMRHLWNLQPKHNRDVGPPHVRQLEESRWSFDMQDHGNQPLRPRQGCRRQYELHILHNKDEDHLVKL